MREQKLAEEQQQATQRLNDIAGSSTMGNEVVMANVVTEISSGREVSEIYLKPSGNESSDEEDNDGVVADAEKEEDEFNQFVKQHRDKQNKKMQISSVVDKS